MAYMSQERKSQIAPVVKAICARHGVKATLAVRHHSTLVLNIAAGSIDFFGDRVLDRMSDERREAAQKETSIDVNPYHWRDEFTGKALAFLSEMMPALNAGNHDKSDSMTDYYDVGWWIDVNVGNYRKPYQLTVPEPPPNPGRLYRAARRGAATRTANREAPPIDLAAWKATIPVEPYPHDMSGQAFYVKTRAGLLMVCPYATWIACRFEEVDRAKAIGVGFNLNPYSGKWNWHADHDAESIAAMVERFTAAVARILPDDAAPATMPSPEYDAAQKAHDAGDGAGMVAALFDPISKPLTLAAEDPAQAYRERAASFGAYLAAVPVETTQAAAPWQGGPVDILHPGAYPVVVVGDRIRWDGDAANEPHTYTVAIVAGGWMTLRDERSGHESRQPCALLTSPRWHKMPREPLRAVRAPATLTVPPPFEMKPANA